MQFTKKILWVIIVKMFTIITLFSWYFFPKVLTDKGCGGYMKTEGIFEKVILDFEVGFEDFLPKRMEILAEGFAKQWDTRQVNEKLLEQDCETLYARSSFEASLIYAYDHQLSYGRWKELFEQCRLILEENNKKDPVFTGGKITLKQLENYVFQGSDTMFQTVYLTRMMETELKAQTDEEDFQNFMKNNLDNFSSVREKARYYFCKYLYYYIREKCDAYYKSCQITEKLRAQYGNAIMSQDRGMQEKFALEELTFLKPLTKLKKEADKVKSGMRVEEKREYLENASLTPGGIFDEFNYFYFGYISTDWLEVLFELYGELEEWPHQTRLKIARSLGLCKIKASAEEEKKALRELEQMAKEQKRKEEEQNEAFARDENMKKKLYQRGRSGEDYFRDFILGKRDINRSTLISFLLFVNTRISLDEDAKITIPRLNRILQNCGFSQMRPTHGFDKFVMKFLKSGDPMEIVEDEVERQVIQGNNFYLYKVYKDAYCHQNELLKYLV